MEPGTASGVIPAPCPRIPTGALPEFTLICQSYGCPRSGLRPLYLQPQQLLPNQVNGQGLVLLAKESRLSSSRSRSPRRPEPPSPEVDPSRPKPSDRQPARRDRLTTKSPSKKSSCRRPGVPTQGPRADLHTRSRPSCPPAAAIQAPARHRSRRAVPTRLGRRRYT